MTKKKLSAAGAPIVACLALAPRAEAQNDRSETKSPDNQSGMDACCRDLLGPAFR